MSDFQRKLENYAKLTVQIGLNLQPGRRLVIAAPIEAADFVRQVAAEAYDAGASDVLVDWSDDALTSMKYRRANPDVLREYPAWKAEGWIQMAREGAAFLTVAAPNPTLLKGVNPDLIAATNKASAVAMREHARMRQNGDIHWCMVCVPTPEWALAVFPGTDPKDAVQQLWNYIFQATRTDLPDPISAWKQHIEVLTAKLEELNTKQYRKLHYSAEGTDLVVELPEDHVWIGGGMRDQNGVVKFVPNLPTEEVFTAPAKYGVNGIVRSTKPLNYGGQLVRDFTVTLRDGKVVDVDAAEGKETLQHLLQTDEGACYLGEVALVPYSSPISQSGITFKNTLYDENAACHLAIGNAYPICIPGGGTMAREQLEERGINTSLVHVDFMMGSADLNIDGATADGRREPVFRDGNWV